MEFRTEKFALAEDIAAANIRRVPTDFFTSPEYLAQEEKSVRGLLALGVTMGAPVTLSDEDRKYGHRSCAYHLVEKASGQAVDGGSASLLHDYLADGTYGGDGPDYLLVACK